jgi:hypothetical protein
MFTAILIPAGAAGSIPETKCFSAIGKSVVKFAATKAKALQKCNDGNSAGKVVSTPGPTCDDGKAQAKIQRAEAKKSAGITKGCCGKDKTCETADDVPISAIVLGRFTACPDPSCGGTIATYDQLVACVDCIAENSIDDTLNLSYLNLTPTNPKDKAQKALNKCQRAIGKNIFNFYGAKLKALGKCNDLAVKLNPGLFLEPELLFFERFFFGSTCDDGKAPTKI